MCHTQWPLTLTYIFKVIQAWVCNKAAKIWHILSCLLYSMYSSRWILSLFTGDPLHSRAASTQPCNVNTHSRAHCSPGARLCEQWGHSCVYNGARLCASARLCRGSPVLFGTNDNQHERVCRVQWPKFYLDLYLQGQWAMTLQWNCYDMAHLVVSAVQHLKF